MHVVATAGHVDHGKSTLVNALTGSDPDRLEEEHRRGLSIELGYCWTELPPVGQVAFVDVPGHERFVSTMLSGVGPVPAVLFVVAADDPWMPQAAEHLHALDALGVSRGVLVVTRSDLCDPRRSLAQARNQLARTALRSAPAVTVSARTGKGLDELCGLLVDMVTALPTPDPDADVRLWVDRCFHVHGAGTVVTGTLPAGRISVGDQLAVSPRTADGSDERLVRVRGLQSLGESVASTTGVARVALNLSGAPVEEIDRGSVLVTPDAWHSAEVVDVRVVNVVGSSAQLGTASAAARHRIRRDSTMGVPARPMLHVGATSAATHCRPLADDLVRLRLERALPLRIGDRALLRDPGSRQVWGVTVLDPAPMPLRRRGDARARATELELHPGVPDLAAEVDRRAMVRLSLLRRVGVDTGPVGEPSSQALRRPGGGGPVTGVGAGDWVVSDRRADVLRERLTRLVRGHDLRNPLETGVPIAVAAQALELPTPQLVQALVQAPLRMAAGRVLIERSAVLPPELETALAELRGDLADQPFAAPSADRLRELGLHPRAVAAAAKAGRLLRLDDGVVLLPGADRTAEAWLRELAQPFTTSEARIRLKTSRRVVLPLLAHLDRTGRTRRLPDDRRMTIHPKP